MRNALLTDGYAMSVGSPFVVNDFVALLLRIVIVEILGTIRLKAVGELPLSVAALRHALGEKGAVSLTYVDVEVVAVLCGVCYVEIEEHDSLEVTFIYYKVNIICCNQKGEDEALGAGEGVVFLTKGAEHP